MWMHLMMSQKFLKLSSLLRILFSLLLFCCSDWVVSTNLSGGQTYTGCVYVLYYLICCWYPLVYFLLIDCILSDWFFSIFPNSVKVLTVFLHSSPIFGVWLCDLFWTIFSGKLLISVSLNFSPWGFILFFHLEQIPLSSRIVGFSGSVSMNCIK